MADTENRSGRDTRLLGLVILIALAVLLVLARFRFPEGGTRPAAVAPSPLERLAARATYDDLAAAVHASLQRVASSVAILEVEADPTVDVKPATAQPRPIVTAPPLERRRVTGVRLTSDLLIAYVPLGFHLASPDPGKTMTVRGFDPVREVAAVLIPPVDGSERPAVTGPEFAGFAYVSVVEPAAGGPTASPVFIGRVDSVRDDRWNGNLLVPGGTSDLPVGALVFFLDGRLIGLVAAQPGGARALVPAPLLENALTALVGSNSGIRP